MPPILPTNMENGQTTYSMMFGHLRPGMVGTAVPATIQSRYAATEIPFGMGLVKGDALDKVKVPSSGADVFDGVATSSMTRESIRDGKAPHYMAGDMIPTMRKGHAVVYAEQAVSPSDPVYLRFTANGDLLVGDFRKDADGGKAVLLENVKWADTITEAGPAMLELNLPGA